MILDYLKKEQMDNKQVNEIDKRLIKDLMAESEMTEVQLCYELLVLVDNLTNKVVSESNKANALKMEIVNLKLDIEKLKDERCTSDYKLRMNRMVKGDKIAYKKQASEEAVLALKELNLTNADIAQRLGVSSATVWRRLKSAGYVKGNKEV